MLWQAVTVSSFLQRCPPPVADDRAVVRPSGRVVVVDPSGAVLVVWTAAFGFTPGGGLEADEDPATAAKRELAEEAGFAVDDVGPVVLKRIARLDFLGRWIEAQETFHLVTVDRRFDPRPRQLERYEQDAFESLEWMSPDDLRSDRRRVYPLCLPDLVEAITGGSFAGAASGSGSEPWEEVDLYDDPAKVVVDVPAT